MEHTQIERINELARKKKTVGLTEAEAAEQQQLRQQYIQEFRANVQATLADVVLQRPDGTQQKLTDLKKQ